MLGSMPQSFQTNLLYPIQPGDYNASTTLKLHMPQLSAVLFNNTSRLDKWASEKNGLIQFLQ